MCLSVCTRSRPGCRDRVDLIFGHSMRRCSFHYVNPGVGAERDRPDRASRLGGIADYAKRRGLHALQIVFVYRLDFLGAKSVSMALAVRAGTRGVSMLWRRGVECHGLRVGWCLRVCAEGDLCERKMILTEKKGIARGPAANGQA